jgi:hypothetical protein
MKVETKETFKALQAPPPIPPARDDKAASDFRAVLREVQAKETPEKTGTLSLPPLSSAIPLITLEATAPAGQASDRGIVSEVETLLDVLEEYQCEMDNPSVSLKQVQPLIERMETETKKLLPALDTLPDDSTLKDILNRILVASSVEVINSIAATTCKRRLAPRFSVFSP